MKSTLARFAACFVSAAAAAPVAHAGHEIIDTKKGGPEPSPFDAGMHEVQIGVGTYFSLNNGGETRPTFNTADLFLRYGWMLNSPSSGGILSGNFEFLIGANVGAIYDGPGDVLAELSLLLRYNFVQPDARCVPYFQIGAGGAYSNAADADDDQRLIGSEFAFNLQAAVGFRYLFSDRCAAYLEGGWRHVSNASLADRNLGLNQLGGQIGVCYFY